MSIGRPVPSTQLSRRSPRSAGRRVLRTRRVCRAPPGRSTGEPLAAAAFAGAGPTKATVIWSSPRRKAMAPHAARPAPLARVLAEIRDLHAAGLGAGKRVRRARHGHDDVVGRPGRPSRRTRPYSPGRAGCLRCRRPSAPAAGRADAGNRSSCASLVTNTNSSSGSRSSTAPTTASSSRRMTSHESRLDSTSGCTRLTTPRAVPRARPRRVGLSEVKVTGRSPGLEGEELRDRRTALEVGRVGRRRQYRKVEHPELDQSAGRGDHADGASCGRPRGGDDGVVLRPCPAPSRQLLVGRAGEQTGRRQQHEARVVGDLQGHRRRDLLARPPPAVPCAAACRGLGQCR